MKEDLNNKEKMKELGYQTNHNKNEYFSTHIITA